ncbi:MAG: AmmeMemoRadiSam system protein B [Bacteroidota bacterium]
MSAKLTVRPPTAAGLFYEDSPEVLQMNIDEYLEHARVPKLKSIVRALVSPHAGYVYSGFAAAHAYKMVEKINYDCVIIVGPSHREYFNGISIYPGDAYETPLGTIPINKEIRELLLEEKNAIIASNEGHRSEHSIEVQLPFLQRVLGDFSFVPIVMGDQRRQLCNELAEAIARVGTNRNILFVASSDLSHYHPYDEAVLLDNRVISELEKFNSETFINKMEEHSFEACGGGPIAAIMSAARRLGANKSEILYYCNSGDITGDKSGVVGYLAAAFV